MKLEWEELEEDSFSAIRFMRHAAQKVQLPLAFMVAPCNMNEKLFAKPLLEKLKDLGVNCKAVLADA